MKWVKLKRRVNRLSLRDRCAVIVPTRHDHPGRVLLAVVISLRVFLFRGAGKAN
jgi:hypothetical protein